jgi:transcription antitermination factor NusG
MPFFEMTYDNKNIFWFVLFAANGKVAKVCDYLKAADIEYFFPLCYRDRRIRNSERTERVLQPIFRNFLFVKSSKSKLDPILKEIRLQLGLSSDLYYRDRGSKEIVVVPPREMESFIKVAGAVDEKIIYLSNEEVRLKQGTKVRINRGIFAGVEGIFMRIKGDRRVVVSLPNLFSVATAFVPVEFVVLLE